MKFPLLNVVTRFFEEHLPRGADAGARGASVRAAFGSDRLHLKKGLERLVAPAESRVEQVVAPPSIAASAPARKPLSEFLHAATLRSPVNGAYPVPEEIIDLARSAKAQGYEDKEARKILELALSDPKAGGWKNPSLDALLQIASAEVELGGSGYSFSLANNFEMVRGPQDAAVVARWVERTLGVLGAAPGRPAALEGVLGKASPEVRAALEAADRAATQGRTLGPAGARSCDVLAVAGFDAATQAAGSTEERLAIAERAMKLLGPNADSQGFADALRKAGRTPRAQG